MYEPPSKQPIVAAQPASKAPAKRDKKSKKGEAAFASAEDFAEAIERNMAGAERDGGAATAVPAVADGKAPRRGGKVLQQERPAVRSAAGGVKVQKAGKKTAKRRTGKLKKRAD